MGPVGQNPLPLVPKWQLSCCISAVLVFGTYTPFQILFGPLVKQNYSTCLWTWKHPHSHWACLAWLNSDQVVRWCCVFTQARPEILAGYCPVRGWRGPICFSLITQGWGQLSRKQNTQVLGSLYSKRSFPAFQHSALANLLGYQAETWRVPVFSPCHGLWLSYNFGPTWASAQYPVSSLLECSCTKQAQWESRCLLVHSASRSLRLCSSADTSTYMTGELPLRHTQWNGT